jgi:uncharacterized membrane protein YfcA
VVSGAFLGSKLLGRSSSAWIRVAFVAVLLWVSVQMLIKGVQ